MFGEKRRRELLQLQVQGGTLSFVRDFLVVVVVVVVVGGGGGGGGGGVGVSKRL